MALVEDGRTDSFLARGTLGQALTRHRPWPGPDPVADKHALHRANDSSPVRLRVLHLNHSLEDRLVPVSAYNY